MQRRRGLAKLQFVCNCSRCSAPDIARSIPCSACKKEDGLVPCYDEVQNVCTAGKCIMPLVTVDQFKDAQKWECQFCGFVTSPPDHLEKVEEELYQSVTSSFGNPTKSSPVLLDALHFDARKKLGPYHWLSLAAAFLRLARLAKSLDGPGMLSMGAAEARQWALVLIEGIRRSIPGNEIIRSTKCFFKINKLWVISIFVANVFADR